MCVGAASWGLLDRFYWQVRQRVAERGSAQVERASESFLSISYDGVTTSPEPGGEYISTAKFEKHLDALAKAGYRPITIDDVVRFYYEKKPCEESAAADSRTLAAARFSQRATSLTVADGMR